MHLFGFIIQKFVTMHGHMNVKKNSLNSSTEYFFTRLLENILLKYATKMSQTLLRSAEAFRLLSICKCDTGFSAFVSYGYRRGNVAL